MMTADQAYGYAEHLWSQERYRAAADAFERFAFAHGDEPRTETALLRAAEAWFAAGDDQASAGACDRLLDRGPDPAIAAKAQLLRSRAHQRRGDQNEALISLHNLIVTSDDAAVVDQARYQGAWVLIEAYRFSDAANWLAAISETGKPLYNAGGLTAELGREDLLEHKNPTLAGTLAVVPGAGHLYSRRYRDAFIAFALTGLTAWSAWEAFDNDQPALGTLLGVVSLNFYVGNIYSAVSAAHKFNRASTRRAVEEMKQAFPVTLQMGLAPSGKGGQMALGIRF